MNQNPLVSILIPTYNREHFIAECIQSALEQTYPNVEVIVVDNMSTDATWRICQQFASRSKRIRIYRNETNMGPVRNWIRCAQEARGGFSKVLFSDDILEPNCIGQMMKMIKPDVGLVVCAARVGESRAISQIKYTKTKPLLMWREYLSRQLDGRLPVSPGAVLLRTADLRENLKPTFPTCVPREFERNGAGPDVMIMLLTAHRYRYVACICEPLVFFRSHQGSFTISNSNNAVSEGYTAAISYFLKKNVAWITWLQYVFISWQADLRQRHSWICFTKYVKDLEGAGTLAEILVAAIFAPLWLIGLAVRRLQ
jgi:glycosyltransferase involved in cell wall biosynthesis